MGYHSLIHKIIISLHDNILPTSQSPRGVSLKPWLYIYMPRRTGELGRRSPRTTLVLLILASLPSSPSPQGQCQRQRGASCCGLLRCDHDQQLHRLNVVSWDLYHHLHCQGQPDSGYQDQDGKKIVVETIEDAVPKETLTGIEVTTKSAAALKAAVDTEASVDMYLYHTKGHFYYWGCRCHSDERRTHNKCHWNYLLLRTLLKHLWQQYNQRKYQKSPQLLLLLMLPRLPALRRLTRPHLLRRSQMLMLATMTIPHCL